LRTLHAYAHMGVQKYKGDGVRDWGLVSGDWTRGW